MANNKVKKKAFSSECKVFVEPENNLFLFPICKNKQNSLTASFEVKQETKNKQTKKQTALSLLSPSLCVSIFDMVNEPKLPLFIYLYSDMPSLCISERSSELYRAWTEKNLQWDQKAREGKVAVEARPEQGICQVEL